MSNLIKSYERLHQAVLALGSKKSSRTASEADPGEAAVNMARDLLQRLQRDLVVQIDAEADTAFRFSDIEPEYRTLELPLSYKAYDQLEARSDEIGEDPETVALQVLSMWLGEIYD